MKKSNIILQAAVTSALLAMSFGAQAGNMATTTRTFATENFGPTQASTVAMVPAATSYAISSPGGVTLSPGQTLTMYLRLSSPHVFTAAPVAAHFTTLNVGLNGATAAPSAVVIGAGTAAGTMAVTYTSAATVSVNLPVNTTVIWSPVAGSAVTATSSTLATAGGVVSIIGSMDGGVVTTTATTLPTSQDPISSPVNIALSATAISGSVVSSANFTVPETKKIDLAAGTGSGTAFAPAATNTTTTNIVNLGSYTFTNNAAVTPVTLTATNYTLPAANAVADAIHTATTVTVNPGTGGSFPVGSLINVFSNLTCQTPLSANATAITATTAGTSVAVSTTAANAVPGTAVKQYVCLTVSTTSAMTPFTPTIAVSLTKAVTSDAATAIAATNAYALTYNGSQIDVRNYVPAAVPGFTQFLRFINTGTITASVSAQVINNTTGALDGSPVVIVPDLLAGAATSLSSAEIEALIGSLASSARPRIRITAPTNGLNVQNFLFTPGGNFTEAGNAQ